MLKESFLVWKTFVSLNHGAQFEASSIRGQNKLGHDDAVICFLGIKSEGTLCWIYVFDPGALWREHRRQKRRNATIIAAPPYHFGGNIIDICDLSPYSARLLIPSNWRLADALSHIWRKLPLSNVA